MIMLTKKVQYKLFALMLYIAGGMTLLTTLLSFGVRAQTLHLSLQLVVSLAALVIVTVSCFMLARYMSHKSQRSPYAHRGKYGSIMLPIGLSLLVLSNLSA